MSEEFKRKLLAFAQRTVQIAPTCKNEESTKLFLILPFLGFLGYDDRNPHEVCPEHGADFSERYKNRVDFAILKDGEPIIAIECKCAGTPLKDERGQLRAYFNAAKAVKMGILTDGLSYEFYADSDEPNMMDQSAFLTIDLTEIAKGKIEDSAVEGLMGLQKANFDPENIGAEAKRKLVFHSVLQQIAKLADSPTDDFTRLLLQNAGLTRVRANALAEYKGLIRKAFKEFIDIKILKRLDLPTAEPKEETAAPKPENAPQVDDKIVTTEAEMEVFRYVQKRLAFLVKDEVLFDAIGDIGFRDFQGKFVVFYKMERKGRLFELLNCKDHAYRFVFPDGAEVKTNHLGDIDDRLLGLFVARVREFDRVALPA